MHIALHLALSYANQAVGHLIQIDFSAQHNVTGQSAEISCARERLASAAAELDRYEALLETKAAA